MMLVTSLNRQKFFPRFSQMLLLYQVKFQLLQGSTLNSVCSPGFKQVHTHSFSHYGIIFKLLCIRKSAINHILINFILKFDYTKILEVIYEVCQPPTWDKTCATFIFSKILLTLPQHNAGLTLKSPRGLCPAPVCTSLYQHHPESQQTENKVTPVTSPVLPMTCSWLSEMTLG